jgi:hypothetical protein
MGISPEGVCMWYGGREVKGGLHVETETFEREKKVWMSKGRDPVHQKKTFIHRTKKI